MRILVTGAKGMLGRDVVPEFEGRGHTVLPLGRDGLDVADLAAVKRVVSEWRPDVIVNCAAYTAVDRAEDEYDAALRSNAIGVRNLALACGESGAALLHVSTDYVFDGNGKTAWGIYDDRKPVNKYGLSKYIGERFLETIAPRYYLVRTSWLFGLNGSNFVETILRLARERDSLAVVDDQWGCPTYTRDLARALADLVESGCLGVYHVTNQGPTTWCRFAGEILAAAGAGTPVRAITSAEYPRPARRPANSVLDPFPLRETVGYLLPDWRDALGRYMAERGMKQAQRVAEGALA